MTGAGNEKSQSDADKSIATGLNIREYLWLGDLARRSRGDLSTLPVNFETHPSPPQFCVGLIFELGGSPASNALYVSRGNGDQGCEHGWGASPVDVCWSIEERQDSANLGL